MGSGDPSKETQHQRFRRVVIIFKGIYPRREKMNVFVWVIQAVLAFMFVMVGAMKLMMPKEKMQDKMGYVEDFPRLKLMGSVS